MFSLDIHRLFVLVISSNELCKAPIRRLADRSHWLSVPSCPVKDRDGCLPHLFQAVGLFIFSIVLRYKRDFLLKKSIFIGSIGIDFIFILLSVLSNSVVAVLLFGYLMNFFHGIIPAFYLFLLATEVAPKYLLYLAVLMALQVLPHGCFHY